MLLNDFFKITSMQYEQLHLAHIELNPLHKIYEGHFPGNPIAPGVCLVQMTKETLEKIIEKKLFMIACSHIKFTAVLNPFINPQVTLKIEHKRMDNGNHQANCTLSDGEIKFLTLKGEFKEQESLN
jgi:3-hydroxyacyl-[acyl-carrier-protein] dehydratase